jgi:protein TonB
LTRTKQTLAKLNVSQGNNKDPAVERQRQQLINLLAQIEKRIQEENARPRKRYISPSTQEINYALYYDQLRRKIEERGTLFFPELQGQKLYGSLIMVITIGLSGQLVSAEVSHSSGNAILDIQAKNIVKGAAPFGARPSAFSSGVRQRSSALSQCFVLPRKTCARLGPNTGTSRTSCALDGPMRDLWRWCL